MKLIIAVLAKNRDKAIRKALLEKNIRMTRLTSQGGYFKHNNGTFLIGVEDSEVKDVIEVFKANCQTEVVSCDAVPYRVHEAIVFVCPLGDRRKF